MRTYQYSVFALLVLSGSAHAKGTPAPMPLEPTRATVNKAGHIYYNAVSGERIVTLFREGQTAPADTGLGLEIWEASIQNACEAFGYSTSYFYAVSDATGSTSLSASIAVLDFGDIALDTVVDCIQINWIVAHPDTDADSDGMVDGVEELAGNWVVWDADNGEERNQSTRLPLIDLMFFNLPGNTPENQSAGALTGWTADVDLVTFGTATDLTFEIGDTDGDCQTANFCNEFVAAQDNDSDGLPDSDLDGDGLFDWGWSVRFIQPGQGNDFDSDSDTGSLPGSSSDTIGIAFGAPEGMAVDNDDGTWTWEVDTSVAAAGFGAEDRFALYEVTSDGDYVYNGGYSGGGFACTGGLISTGGFGYTPPGMFQFILYGTACRCSPGCGQADLNNDETLNFFDVSLFLQGFNAGDDYNGDGSTNFFDVSAFLTDFNAGCP
jgi:hypothetical protein